MRMKEGGIEGRFVSESMFLTGRTDRMRKAGGQGCMFNRESWNQIKCCRGPAVVDNGLPMLTAGGIRRPKHQPPWIYNRYETRLCLCLGTVWVWAWLEARRAWT